MVDYTFATSKRYLEAKNNDLTALRDYRRHAVSQDIMKMKDQLSIYHLSSIYTSMYSKITGFRKLMLKRANALSEHYIVHTLINQFVSDALTPDINTGQVLKLTSKNAEIQKEIDQFVEDFGIDTMALDVAGELVQYGSYTYMLEINGKTCLSSPDDKSKKDSQGVTDVLDIVEQENILPIHKRGKVRNFLYHDGFGRLSRASRVSFLHFELKGHRKRINLEHDIMSMIAQYPDGRKEALLKKLKNVPKYARVPISFITPLSEKIQELELLEKLVPATKLNHMSGGNIVGMTFPDGTTPRDALDLCQEMEGLINQKTGVNTASGELTVEDIINTAGNTKVIPIMGDRGRLDKVEYRDDEPDNLLGSVEELRRVICDTIGIPYELVFRPDGEHKQETLRRYGKYLRKLKIIQKAVTDGVQELIYIHLANRGIEFNRGDIQVMCCNKLVEVDNLDKLEHADLTISTLTNIKAFFTDLIDAQSPFRLAVNIKAVAEYIQKELKTVGLEGVIDVSKLESKFLEPIVDTPPEGEEANNDF